MRLLFWGMLTAALWWNRPRLPLFVPFLVSQLPNDLLDRSPSIPGSILAAASTALAGALVIAILLFAIYSLLAYVWRLWDDADAEAFFSRSAYREYRAEFVCFVVLSTACLWTIGVASFLPWVGVPDLAIRGVGYGLGLGSLLSIVGPWLKPGRLRVQAQQEQREYSAF